MLICTRLMPHEESAGTQESQLKRHQPIFHSLHTNEESARAQQHQLNRSQPLLRGFINMPSKISNIRGYSQKSGHFQTPKQHDFLKTQYNMIFADFSSIFWTQFGNLGHSVDGRTKALKNKPVFPSNSISRHAMHSSPTVHWQRWSQA